MLKKFCSLRVKNRFPLECGIFVRIQVVINLFKLIFWEDLSLRISLWLGCRWRFSWFFVFCAHERKEKIFSKIFLESCSLIRNETPNSKNCCHITENRYMMISSFCASINWCANLIKFLTFIFFCLSYKNDRMSKSDSREIYLQAG